MATLIPGTPSVRLAIACLNETIRLNVPENAAARGAQLFEGVQKLMDKYEMIGDVRGGHGLMTAIEVVSNRVTKSPDKSMPAKVQEVAYDHGAMVRVSGPNIIMSPPLILTETDVEAILAALDAGFRLL